MRAQAIDLSPKGKITTELYKMEMTILEFELSDFYEDKRTKKYVPGKSAIDKIAEAAGVSFIGDNCTVVAEDRKDQILGERTVFVGRAQGKIRTTDGSMRESSVCEYEFDPVGRVYEDFKLWDDTAKKKVSKDPWDEKYKTEVNQQILENMKVGRQRANTGARLRVIRELIGMPNGFYKTEIETMGLRFGRVIQNTDFILQTPEGKILASCQALNMDAAKIFGAFMQSRSIEKIEPPQPVIIPVNQRDEEPVQQTELEKQSEPVQTPSQNAELERHVDEIVDAIRTGESIADTTQEDTSALDIVLEQYLTEHKNTLNGNSTTGNPYSLGTELLSKPHTAKEVQEMIERIKTYLSKRGITA